MRVTYEENKEYTSGRSRYQVLRVVSSQEGRYLETFNPVTVPEYPTDNYHVITKQEVNRLDIVANDCYGDSRYWWALALANNMIDPFVVPEGTMIRVPPITTLYNSRNKILSR